MEDLDFLSAARNVKDVDALRDAVACLTKRSVAPSLAELLLEDWHDSHEDIVLELGLIGDPSTVGSIAKAIHIPFDHLVKWGNLHEFQRKCAYALARIGTPESRDALEAIAKHSDPNLRAYGEEGLQHWPMPYEGDQYA